MSKVHTGKTFDGEFSCVLKLNSEKLRPNKTPVIAVDCLLLLTSYPLPVFTSKLVVHSSSLS